jgi:hypothetical protein
MKHPITTLALALGCAMLAGGAQAQASAAAAGASKPLTPQQQKMSDCSKANKGKTGDDYKNGVKSCMNGEPAAASAPKTQQQKMSDCSKANKGKTGDDYKNAMKTCLSS